jgi:hypothetical protein
MARNVFPAFNPGPLFPVRLEDRRLHPLDAQLDDVVDRFAARALDGLGLPQLFGQCGRGHRLEPVDLAAGVVDGEGLRVIGPQHDAALLASGRVGELEIERRHASRDDAHIEAGAFAVVDFDPLGDPLLAHAVGQDDAAIARALAGRFGSYGSIRHGFSSEGLGPWARPWASQSLEGRERLRAGP